MTHAANATLYRKLPYDPLKDFLHVGLFGVFGLALLVPANTVISFYAYIVMMGYLVIAIGGMILLGMRVKRKAAAKFGKERLERGLGWYAAMRALQMRFMRLPKPQVKRGQYPD